MNITKNYRCGIAGALLLCSGTAFADADYSIGYHETIGDMRIAESRRDSEGNRTMTMSMFVFGSEVLLELESHVKLTSSINAGSVETGTSALTTSDNFEALRGKVVGVDGSWVRLTRSGNSYTGVVWNGEQLLAIEPFSKVHEMLINSDADESDPLSVDLTLLTGSSLNR